MTHMISMHSECGLSHLKRTVQCNVVSHWLRPCPEWSPQWTWPVFCLCCRNRYIDGLMQEIRNSSALAMELSFLLHETIDIQLFFSLMVSLGISKLFSRCRWSALLDISLSGILWFSNYKSSNSLVFLMQLNYFRSGTVASTSYKGDLMTDLSII